MHNDKGVAIQGGTFNKAVYNFDGSIISGGTFGGVVENRQSPEAVKNIIAKNGFYVNFHNIENIIIKDNGVNLDSSSFSKINNIEVSKDAKVIFKDVNIKEAAAKTTGEGLIQIDKYTTQMDMRWQIM